LNLDRFGKYRGTVTLLGGLKHVYGQNYPQADGSRDEPISANLFTTGIETAFDIRLHKLVNFSPFMRVLYTPAGEGTRDALPEESLALNSTADIHLGLRLSVELWPVGW
jgi:hypothetical protein